jgi:flavodoxin
MCVSVSNHNTEKVARAMAEVLDAEVVAPEDVDPSTIADYDLVGFGSGIFMMSFHSRLRAFVRELPQVHDVRAFVFATSGSPEPPVWRYTRSMQRTLEARGFSVDGVFTCRGYDTWLPLRLIGGINKGHPDDADLEAARAFARDL